MSTSELEPRNIAVSMRKSMENLVVSSGDAIGQSISQALTLSNVLAHHSSQAPHSSTRSISRSPSPSLRSAESGGDGVETDKPSASDPTILVPSLSADAVSVSSSSDIAGAVLRDGGKTSGQQPRGSAEVSSTRGKKKSWYNALYPTYKSKCDDFKRLFKDLPDDERLIVDYSCALQKDILVHGRLYASQNYLCFYASIFGWGTTLALRWKEVTAITKEKTALVIPNAILVCTEGEKNFLTSFSGRDKAYLMLFRIWQNALMDQPMASQEIWQWVHSCYGEELGFNSDEEGYGRDLIGFPLEAVADSVSEVELMESSLETGAETGDGRQRSVSRLGDHSPPLVSNGVGDPDFRRRGDRDPLPLPTDVSDSSDSEHDHKPHNGDNEKCSSPHSGKLILRQQYPINIDLLFTFLFTNSKFNLELLAARGTTDYVQAQWEQQAGVKCRQVSYMLSLTSGPLGPKQVHVSETQVMNKCSKPGYLYSIDVTTENAGIPYADYFTVEVHYCLQKTGENSTDLAIYGQVNYKKHLWPMIKTFLEKSALTGVEEYGRLVASRLSAEAGGTPGPRVKGRRRRVPALHEPASVPPPLPHPPVPHAPPRAPPALWSRGILILLLLLNGLLYWRLYHPPVVNTHLEDRLSSLSAGQMSQWAGLLQQHSSQHRSQLSELQEGLLDTIRHLRKTEDALQSLLVTSSQHDAENNSPEAHDASDASQPTAPPDDSGGTEKEIPRGEL